MYIFKLLITVNGIALSTWHLLMIAVYLDLPFWRDIKDHFKKRRASDKTAQKLIIELKDKLSLEEAFELSEVKRCLHHVSDNRNEAAPCLNGFGLWPGRVSEGCKAL